MKMLMIAPFVANGRYPGGVLAMANSSYDTLNNNFKNLQISKFNSYRMNMTANTKGKVSLSTVRNFLLEKRDLKKEMKKKYDILFIHSSRRLGLLKDLMLIDAVKCKTKIIQIHTSSSDSIFGNQFLRKLIIKRLKKNSIKIIVLSNKIKDDLIELGIDKKRLFIVNNYYKNFVGRFEPKSSVKNFIFLGSIEKNKGIFDLIESFNYFKNVNLSVCGSFISENDKNIFFKLIENKNIKYFGYVKGDKKTKILENSDCLILPSYAEGLPVSILEAMAHGCLIITTPVGSIPELIKGNFIQYCEPGNISSIKKSIELFVKLPKEEVKSFSTESYEYSQNFTEDKYCKQFMEILK